MTLSREEQEKEELRKYYSCPNYIYFIENYNRILDYFTPKRISHHFSLSKLKYGDLIKFRNLSCCYLFTDNTYNVLYIGSTKDFFHRLLIHKHRKDKLTKATFVITIQSENNLKEEKLAIEHFQPKYNIRLRN